MPELDQLTCQLRDSLARISGGDPAKIAATLTAAQQHPGRTFTVTTHDRDYITIRWGWQFTWRGRRPQLARKVTVKTYIHKLPEVTDG